MNNGEARVENGLSMLIVSVKLSIAPVLLERLPTPMLVRDIN